LTDVADRNLSLGKKATAFFAGNAI